MSPNESNNLEAESGESDDAVVTGHGIATGDDTKAEISKLERVASWRIPHYVSL